MMGAIRYSISTMLMYVGLTVLALMGDGFNRVHAAENAQIVDLAAMSLADIEKLVAGQIVTFRAFDGKTYQAVYSGERRSGGENEPDRFMMQGIVEVDPDTSKPIEGNGTLESENKLSAGAGAALGAAFTTMAGYIAVPPSMRAELKAREMAFQEAIAKHQFQLKLYSQSIVDNLKQTSDAFAQLKSVANGTVFVSPSYTNTNITGVPDFSSAPWDLKVSLESSYVALTSINPASYAHAQIKATGIIAINEAQKNLQEGRVDDARAAGQLAESAAYILMNSVDLIIGLNPMTAMARDATELITGRDLLTGKMLAEGELWMRGISLGVSLVSGGAASTISQALSRIAPTVNAATSVRNLLNHTMQISKHIKMRWWRVDGMGEVVTDTTVRDWAFDAITKGKAYWDTKERTTAFFIQRGDEWMQLALDVEKGVAVTVVPRKLTYDFDKVIKTDQGLAKRFVPFDEVSLPTKETTEVIKIYLPGK
ncbi:pre-toxin TG domain-containing protein [Pseudomonas mandelii]|uniref:pre-toxin TG domain-containing protein n=1 Tax=Pseudomonas mandelii TaxID=75612 RepID=UPI00224AB305|nr:pre-toxin TG domain-containing protein [Pseudomonas mandelii]MCX2896665.1 pre-toxin TG domain-containing protein [Pseudomonas mandelii]